METKQFQAESKRLLDLMINSIYTHREIFLRELISNASDAIDKLYYHALSEDVTGLTRESFAIELRPDKAARTLVISDNGCGMDAAELEENLGTIAKSGSLAFKRENLENSDEIDIIGQFGVGFYSAFMVSSHVKVLTKKHGSSVAYCWESSGAEGYTIRECEKEGHGTEITLTIKENTDDDQYDEFLDSYRLESLVKKYSDYIRYPIRMEMERTRMVERGEDDPEDKAPEYEKYTEVITLNSMVPIWKKKKSEVTDEDYHSFYQEKFFDYQPPLQVITSSTEGAATYNALLFIPSRAPFNYYSRDYEKGLQLYASGVLIMERCADLLPDCFSFVKGLVDSQDLSLNISREMLQHDRQLTLIAGRLEKKIQSELLSLLQNRREEYEGFWKNFGLQLKYGVYSEYGSRKELLQDLLLFRSSGGKLVTLGEYLAGMKESQKYIYYATGETPERIERLPQTEFLREQGYEILYLTDEVDEFALKMMQDYQGKAFRSASDSDIELDDAEKERGEQLAEENRDLLSGLRELLGEKVAEVRLSTRLKSHPVCLSTTGEVSLEMEKVLSAMPGNDSQVKASRVLELNPDHPVFKTLSRIYGEDRERAGRYAALLYDQALLIEGLPIEDPVAFASAVCELMI